MKRTTLTCRQCGNFVTTESRDRAEEFWTNHEAPEVRV